MSEVERVLAGGGEAGALARSVDWSKTALGPVEGWSQSLRSTASLVLQNHWAMLLWWGPDFVSIYNDAYRPVLGDKHPRAMGQPLRECWKEVFDVVGPMAERPFRGGPASTMDDLALLLDRNFPREEAHFQVAYSPVFDDTVKETGIGGVLAAVTETTGQIFGERQLRTLRELAARSAQNATTVETACTAAASAFGDNAWDVPFALIYLFDGEGTARLVAQIGNGPPAAHEYLLRSARENRADVVTLDVTEHQARSPWQEPVRTAFVQPLASPDQLAPYGAIVYGVSPHRVFDIGYRGFFELAAGHVVTAIRNARALEEERKRAEALAEIDRAKSRFFSNVSHEFRTPLTLMLGPTEDALGSPDQSLSGEALQTVYRNELRLLKLVNALLDTSRVDAGRMTATFEPLDVGAFTADVASTFRAAIERAGLVYEVDTSRCDGAFLIDRDLWETILLNLLSNALKFTLAGSIRVELAASDDGLELVVGVAGTGIAEHDLPRLFERFYRVESSAARTHEGSGIGLSLVMELAKLHGGMVTVESELGSGSRFCVRVPARRASSAPTRSQRRSAAHRAYVEEAQRWDNETDPRPDHQSAEHILVADDNADMRDYLRRLLEPHWSITAVGDGVAALDSIEQQVPALVLTDVMMPNLDGFGLLRAIRAEPRTQHVPVIMLSARAGDEARVDGLEAGADDYVVKPFSARELVARVKTHLALAHARSKAESAARAKDEFLALLGHELRNPLAPIVTALELMRMRGGEETIEQQTIERQVKHLTRLVDDLLDISRITRGVIELEREPLVLGSIIDRAIETARPLVEQKQHRLTAHVPETIIVYADATRLTQVFTNLLTNAARYTPSRGIIHITAAQIGLRVRIAITDSGIGIQPHMLTRIFDLFQRGGNPGVARSEGGLGIGLALVRNLVQLHGGTVTAESAGEGRGSTFEIDLPIVAVQQAVPPGPSVASEIAKRRVLIVDDNEDAAELLAELLRKKGHEVEVAYDAPQALLTVSRFGPDTAILDIGLPSMDGYELAQRLRRGGFDHRLIALSGYGQAPDRARSQEAGFDAHLVKPVDYHKLALLIDGAEA
jgi:signal transduction histidine kinase